ncbi:DUF4185 domain-containing protein [Agromyces subbeticus]|uniref:DUF4185 domain-containing protein n=1 Tax=Agromyces subbeticus TaxID=293890 RepID=UPI001B7F8691|nr:DUF4185 domain-containing protein [Agromyces subbeticus]
MSAPPIRGAGFVDDNTVVAAATVGDVPTRIGISDGDLWPNCWADDDAIYAANGDGSGFGDEFSDIVVNRIDGGLDDLIGEALAVGDAVGQVWSGEGFTRKPTGMACVGGDLYLAVQDLRADFNEAPAATIAVSHDKGRTWEWDRSAPMFDDHVFTTIMFADFGKDAEHAPEGYLYAYGLDGNWRDSFDDSVPDPVDLWLARVPQDAVQDRSAWEFFAGLDGDEPRWSDDLAERVAVLHDERLQHPSNADAHAGGGQTVGAANLSVLSQGGVTFNEPLGLYLYTSWTELTFEFSASKAPWGPFELFLSRDFGRYPWTDVEMGGYGTTIPSKFISDDGRRMWVQSNVCPCAPAGISSYWFGLRPLALEPR